MNYTLQFNIKGGTGNYLLSEKNMGKNCFGHYLSSFMFRLCQLGLTYKEVAKKQAHTFYPVTLCYGDT